MRHLALTASLCTALGTLSGCQRKVPDDIVKKSLEQALRHAPGTAGAMCGVPVRGLTNTKISISERGKENTGVAHVKGRPTLGAGAPSECEGDLEFAYSYKTKTVRKKTTTTWSLDRIKLKSVETAGVVYKPVDESPDDGDEDGDDGSANAAGTVVAAGTATPAASGATSGTAPSAVAPSSAGLGAQAGAKAPTLGTKPVAVTAAAGGTPAAAANAKAAPAAPVAPPPITSVSVQVRNECATKVEYCVASTGSTLNTSLGSNSSTSHSLGPGTRIQLKSGSSCGNTIFTVPASKDQQRVLLCKR